MQIDNIEKKKNIKTNSDYIANHYGFDFLDIEEKVFKKDTLVEDEKIKILKSFKTKLMKGKKMVPMKMFFYKKPIIKKVGGLGIDIVNIESAIAEAAVIKTATSILSEEGYTNFTIVLNAIGDRDSRKSFKHALSEYYRKHRKDLKAIEIKKITRDPISIYYTDNKKYLDKINSEAPNPMQFLSERSIKHFQDVIEFLESFKINYLIDEKMTGSKLFFSKIIFKIMANAPGDKEQSQVGYGGRYDEIAEEMLKKKKISAIGLTLNFNKKNTAKLKLTDKKVNIHLLKIGSTSKLKYLDIIESLSKINTPIFYDIKEEKISKQVKKAIGEKADYAIIMGETEAKQDKVVVRKMSDFSQSEVHIKDIGKYIKKLIK
jgi:histidyl-tRNA synthetase